MILHTPLMSGSNFVHGIVLVGAMVALGGAHTPLEKTIGFIGVLLAAGNAVGGLCRHRADARNVQVERVSWQGAAGQGGALMEVLSRETLIQASYFVTAALFILGLKRMSSPVTARSGILWAGAGMLVATVVSFLYPGMTNYELILAAIVVGGGLAWWSGKRVAMTDMPQMIALYNGMGGGAGRGDCRSGALPWREPGLRDFNTCGRGRHHRFRVGSAAVRSLLASCKA